MRWLLRCYLRSDTCWCNRATKHWEKMTWRIEQTNGANGQATERDAVRRESDKNPIPMKWNECDRLNGVNNDVALHENEFECPHRTSIHHNYRIWKPVEQKNWNQKSSRCALETHSTTTQNVVKCLFTISCVEQCAQAAFSVLSPIMRWKW